MASLTHTERERERERERDHRQNISNPYNVLHPIDRNGSAV